MKDFINDQMTNFNLDQNPWTKKMLINYISIEYQEDADYSNESLMREWWYLYENNLLALLNTAEGLNSYPGKDDEAGNNE
ncbi:hypothetical protein LB465_07070 [Salegentibacter sp. LM13S]|uniref:hypothetical protein n=1 Tax=Salegentibacter lacus TaxID=2873599 RepID=UPI001CCB06A4|nr:hypothetical protein [Salegentibacter lacus]MBZ9630537.1 hypothetical protein [Salegentibacter lacus]